MITLTPDAISQLEDLVADEKTKPEYTGENADALGLRLFVEKGGCAGMQYGMKLDTPAPEDTIVPAGRVRVIIDAASAKYLKGIEIDYQDTLSDSGFKIHNPNASRSCGCGTSFEVPDAPALDPDAQCV
jgi:iron-sulfur cluster assembly protein